jgi:methionine-rich copper-binding protein CopC
MGLAFLSVTARIDTPMTNSFYSQLNMSNTMRQRQRNMLWCFLVIYLILTPLFASAHSPLNSLSPEDGAVLQQAPAEIKIGFKVPTKLIKVKVLKIIADRKGSILGSLFGRSDGDEVSLDGGFLMKNADNHVIALPLLQSGNYSVEWRAMGGDGHVIKGDFSFQVTAK